MTNLPSLPPGRVPAGGRKDEEEVILNKKFCFWLIKQFAFVSYCCAFSSMFTTPHGVG